MKSTLGIQVSVVNRVMEEDGTIYGYDDKGNNVYTKTVLKHEIWKEFDEKNRIIHYLTSDGHEIFYEYEEDEVTGYLTIHMLYPHEEIDEYRVYDKSDRLIFILNSNNTGYEYKYDESGNFIKTVLVKIGG